jgi:lactaldehyde dehydrogenase/glycolaldehyde dehydrogenase
MVEYQNFIGGQFVASPHSNRIDVANPSTGEVISRVPDSSTDQLDAALDAATTSQPAWAKLPAIQRAGYLRKIANLLRDHVEPLAKIITLEQGKTLPLARVEVRFTADYLDYMAEWGRRIEGEIIQSDRPNENIFLFRQAIGVIGGILPWNFPFFLIARKLAPALICGNSIVIKPSEETPNNAFEFFKFVEQAGLPEGVANLVSGLGHTVGAALSSSAKVGMISFTGSVEVGSKIMAAAAKNITKVNLELGGKAPALVMADADLPLAARAVRESRVINSGQVCNCAERIYVHEKVADAFVENLVREMNAARFGDPNRDESIDYGPLINREGFEKVEALVAGAKQAGAEVVAGGRRGEGEGGYYYEPTVIVNCHQDMEIVRREIFGPVAPVVTFSDLDEAIAFANDTDYGLTSSIYTRDINVAMRVCNEIRFGETYVNREHFEAMQGFHAGWKKSGIGGADGKHGLYEFLQTHVVYLQHHV